FTDATLAYQGRARQLWDESVVLNKLVCGPLKPDLTLLFDMPPKNALKKAQARNSGEDRLEQEGLAFQEEVRKGYLAVANQEPERVRVIAVKPSIEETYAEVQNIIGLFLHGNSRANARA